MPEQMGEEAPRLEQLAVGEGVQASTLHSTHVNSLCSIPGQVESHPFDLDTMLFMDWRDDHLDDSPQLKKSNQR